MNTSLFVVNMYPKTNNALNMPKSNTCLQEVSVYVELHHICVVSNSLHFEWKKAKGFTSLSPHFS